MKATGDKRFSIKDWMWAICRHPDLSNRQRISLLIVLKECEANQLCRQLKTISARARKGKRLCLPNEDCRALRATLRIRELEILELKRLRYKERYGIKIIYLGIGKDRLEVVTVNRCYTRIVTLSIFFTQEILLSQFEYTAALLRIRIKNELTGAKNPDVNKLRTQFQSHLYGKKQMQLSSMTAA
jgi:hypothetical protein